MGIEDAWNKYEEISKYYTYLFIIKDTYISYISSDTGINKALTITVFCQVSCITNSFILFIHLLS